ncbi:hypothetical protein [Mucilaginibacter psychrotolerans]|uniref:MoxR-vWA-beta-propeller ternary system domain-containing protein n=1 Tax=Mucilaginibacter psychrotolerans TaxID=1524096 RepID=A0A4Y8S4D2_9SPHI|nr:hypothetical protein [Mucilaginibacter psychrotolerans]TFF33485.1 hypothetical protein E2R66_25720 [Mucilaginibacter psychrotolerans]
MEKILVLETKYKAALGEIRGISGLKAAEAEGLIWLRGIFELEKPDPLIAGLPALSVYMLDGDGLLFPAGKPTPVAKLPVLDWQTIKIFLPVTMPVSAIPGSIVEKLELRLGCSAVEHEPFALLCTLFDWKAYADKAPETRLRPLRFAVSAEGQVLVFGQPLPNVAGKLYWAKGQLLLPAGFDFDPPALAELLPESQGVSDAFMLFNADATWDSIPLSGFQPARRSAIRLTSVGHA